MSDFHQTGCITTLHRLSVDGTARLEAELRPYAESRPIGLILPALFSEFRRPAMPRIVDQLSAADYVRHTVVVLAQAGRSEYEEARALFDRWSRPVTFIWIDGPRVQELFATLKRHGISAGPDGKGRSCWLACGYLLAAADCQVIALHDCDIVNYHRGFLARLCYPLVNPDLDFDFGKAFYARVSDRMHGRVTRLFMTPLIRALTEFAPNSGWLRFLDSFRYCLAGEFAMKVDLARVNCVPADWGLEVGTLAEVYRNCARGRACQVEMADNYEHKHQPLSQHDPEKGLRRMSLDIAKALFRTLHAEGAVRLTRRRLDVLRVRYLRTAENMMESYRADAMLNGLRYDRSEEEAAVETFSRSLQQASSEFFENPLGATVLPSWNRVRAAVPDFCERLLEAVVADNELACCQAA